LKPPCPSRRQRGHRSSANDDNREEPAPHASEQDLRSLQRVPKPESGHQPFPHLALPSVLFERWVAYTGICPGVTIRDAARAPERFERHPPVRCPFDPLRKVPKTLHD